jgi:predicted dithiol-disulfide oxidoreductase (DUF899 family)
MPTYDSGPVTNHPVVAHSEWLAARIALLEREKQFNKQRDELTRLRQALPWERVDKPYEFDGPDGRETLAQLFKGCRQLVVYHFMFAPEDKDGCPHCSFWADQFDGAPAHLAQRYAAFTAISRAPLAKIEKFKKRMGWSFSWVSSGGTDFNYDLGASFSDEDLERGPVIYNYKPVEMDMRDREGISIFAKDKRGVFHTYSTYARGIDLLNTTYNFLDLTPKGRDEAHLSDSQAWVRHKEKYES